MQSDRWTSVVQEGVAGVLAILALVFTFVLALYQREIPGTFMIILGVVVGAYYGQRGTNVATQAVKGVADAVSGGHERQV